MTEMNLALANLFSELVEGANGTEGAFILNTGDIGLLRSLDKLSAADASQSTNDGATIAAHARHVSYGLSLLSLWAKERGDPFTNARWDEAWKTSAVDATQWDEIRGELRDESRRWLDALGTTFDVSQLELRGMVGSVAHLAYHLGAIRQIEKSARGPKEGPSSVRA